MTRLLNYNEILEAQLQGSGEVSGYGTGAAEHRRAETTALLTAQRDLTDRLSREDERRQIWGQVQTIQDNLKNTPQGDRVFRSMVLTMIRLGDTGYVTEAGAGGSTAPTRTCCLCGYQGPDVNRRLPDRSWPKGSIMPEYACDSPQWCAERAKGKHSHTCYYCNHEGTDVNRIAVHTTFEAAPGAVPFDREDHTFYCCDDGDACDARIKETA